MNKKQGVLLAASSIMLLPGTAWSQAFNELNPNTIEGATIESNSDNSVGEYFIVTDSGVQVLRADGDVETSVSNNNDVNIRYDNDNGGAGSFSITSGGSNVLTADNAGAIAIANSLGVGGPTTLSNSLGVSGATTLSNSLGVAGATTLNNTLAVDSNGGGGGGTRFSVNASAATTTSTDGNTTNTLSNSGHVLAHVDGTATNSIAVGQTQQETIGANTFSFGTTIEGGMLIQGDLGVNGNIYSLNPTANTSVAVGNNGLDINGAANRTSLVADSNANPNDGRSAVTLEEDQASFQVYNQTTGTAHGLTVNQTETVLSGGTRSTSLTLNDNGATFRNTDTGGPARVTGVADGASKFDAVNYGQLKGAYGGIASVAAMANIPTPAAGKNFSLGIGFGNFEGENAFAFGGAARIDEYWSVQASVGHSDDNSSFGAGVGFSW
jgi:hypothetical protein